MQNVLVVKGFLGSTFDWLRESRDHAHQSHVTK